VASPIDLNGGSITGANLTAAALAFTPQNLSAINIQTGTMPVFTSNPVPATGVTGTTFSTLLTASGYPTPTFSLASGTLPPGLTLKTNGALFGTPSTVGTYTGTFAATNSQGSPTQAFNIVITAPVAVLFTSTPLDRSLRVGVVNTYTLVASGSPAPAFSVQSGGLPPGLTLDAAGNLTGTPTTTGDYTGVFAATNSVNTVTQNFHFAVTAATTLPQAFAWGAGVNGQIGNNTTTGGGVHVPVAVTMSGALAGREIIALAVGSEHTLALASDGTVYAWGSNLHGQLGDGTANNASVPVAVNRTAGTSALAGRTVIAIAAAGYNSMALASDGRVYTWGDNTYGQLGNSTMGGASYVPVAVNLVPGYSALAGKTVTGIATAGTFFVALSADGTVCTWGRNNFGQLGNNSTTDTLVPVAVNVAGGVSALAGKTVTAVAAGGEHVLALASDGTVYAWGDNSLAQLGNSSVATTSLVPVAVNTTAGVSNLAGKTITAISAGTFHGLALASDGSVSAWGYNFSGQLGNGATGLSADPVAVSVTSRVSALAGKTVTQIVGSGYHSLALASDGTVCAWGSGSSGELGDNGSTDQLVPVAVNTVSGVSALAGQSVVALAVGSESAHCVVLAKPAPATVPVFTNTALTPSIVTGSAASFALTASGTPAAVFTVQSGALPTGITLNSTSGLVTGTPTTTGTFTGVFAATNTAGSATQNFSFTVTAPVFDFTAFLNLNFTPAELADATISGPLADPDHDGVPNLLEFALGSDPRNSNVAGWTLVQEGANWVYRYTRPAGGAVGVTYIVESSNDLVTWTTVTSVIESTAAGVDTMKATVPTNGTSNFFRLRVTQP
jgi:alpha-tubulin suppressor-like RCC1 family protein